MSPRLTTYEFSSEQSTYTYKPQKDITTYELAQLLPIFGAAWRHADDQYQIASGKIPSSMNSTIEQLSKELRRHFQPPAA